MLDSDGLAWDLYQTHTRTKQQARVCHMGKM